MVNFTMLVHNRPKLTHQSLSSLQKAGWDGLTLTILDDRSDKELKEDLEWRQDFHEEELLVRVPDDSGGWGTGELRNLVIGLSEDHFGRGDYLYLSDNDVYFTEGWLEKLIECYEAAWEYGCRVIGGYNHPYHQPYESTVLVGKHGVNAVHALALQSMLMKWEVWDRYGPFCATPPGRVCQSEDVDFTNKLRADGFTLGVVTPALVVNTGITNSFGEKIPGWELVKAQCPEGVICE